MVDVDLIEVGDFIEIKHALYGGRWEVVGKFEMWGTNHFTVTNDLGRVDEFSEHFIKMNAERIIQNTFLPKKSSELTTIDQCKYHEYITTYWFSMREFTYCKKCGKTKDEDKGSNNKREFF